MGQCTVFLLVLLFLLAVAEGLKFREELRLLRSLDPKFPDSLGKAVHNKEGRLFERRHKIGALGARDLSHRRHRMKATELGRTGSSLNSQSSEEPNGKRQKVWLNFNEANKQIAALIKKKRITLKKDDKDKKKKRKKACHSIAMLECGCKMFKEISEVTQRTKCEIREDFFHCLDENSKEGCRHANKKVNRLLRPKAVFNKRMEEIIRVLWTTRGCLLPQIADADNLSLKPEFKVDINSSFCSAFSLSSPVKPKKRKMRKQVT